MGFAQGGVLGAPVSVTLREVTWSCSALKKPREVEGLVGRTFDCFAVTAGDLVMLERWDFCYYRVKVDPEVQRRAVDDVGQVSQGVGRCLACGQPHRGVTFRTYCVED